MNFMYPFFAIFSKLSALAISLFRIKNTKRKLVCLALMLSLLILPVQGSIFEQLSVFASTTMKSVNAPVGYIPNFIKWLFSTKPVQRQAGRKETQAERINAVTRLQISPQRFVGYQEQNHKFTAQPTNNDNQAIYGIKPIWESSNPEILQIDDSGRARFLQPGQARVICRVGSVEASVPVQIRFGSRPPQTDEEWRADQTSLNPDGTTSTGTTGSLLRGLIKQLMPTVEAQNNGSPDLAYDELYTDPKNLVGSPINRVMEGTRIGAVLPEGSNAEFAVPLVSLGGRGIGTSLALFYNSRVWTRRSNAIAFNAITGEPSPGFSLGFGRLIGYDYNSTAQTRKFMWVEPDGTRHLLGTVAATGTNTASTTDGSDLSFIGSYTNGGTLTYPNGTYILIEAVNNRLLPTQILDRNGNYIQIVYKDSSNGFSPLSLDYVTDTLGRVIQFNYDGSYRLTSIDKPGFGGDSTTPITQTVVKFDYQAVTASSSFSGLTVERSPVASTSCLKHIYFPAANNGYIFTYSAFGGIGTVSLRRAMSLNYLGVIQDGTEKASVAFNYPTSGTLTDTPAFTQRTESAENAPTATYSYSSSSATNILTSIITRPDSSTLNLTRSTDSSSIANGLLIKTEVKYSSTTYAKSELSYVTAASAPRVESMITYDDTNTPTKEGFSYTSNGDVSDKREYGYQISSSWVVRRRTHYTYNTSIGIRGLVTLTELYDGTLDTNDSNDTLIAKSSITYDDYSAMGGMEDYSGQPAPPGHIGWGVSVTTRGNATGTTVWYDLANNLSTTRLKKYDIFGNVLKEQVSCCNVKTYSIPETNCWSGSEKVTSGDESGLHVSEENEADFNTSLVTSCENAQGKVETYNYDTALRLREMTLFTDATASTTINDGTLTITSTVTYKEYEGQSFEVTRTLTTTKNHDGWGRVIQEINPFGVQVNTTYNAMGQVSSVSNPFPSGGATSYATNYTYDKLGRRTLVTLPDGNTFQTAYSGLTVTVTDPVNRKMKHESDSLGRQIKITEQDVPSGILNQETSYTYNLLDKITEINQGGQYRKFKYDNMGRLLYDNIPEQTPTISEQPGVLAPDWTTKYTYTNFNAVETMTDARNVVKTNSYDALNRLTNITYNTTGATNVATTPSVAMTYDSSGSNNGLLSQVASSAVTENYSYNFRNEISSVTHSIDSKSYTNSYEYNQAGQVSKLTYPSGYNYYFNHDNKGRLETLSSTAGSGQTNGYMYGSTYNTIGQLMDITLGNGVVESYGYSSDRLQMTSQTAIKSSTTLLNLGYDYDASSGENGSGSTAGNSGQLMGISGTINAITESAAYKYDNLGRLVTANQSSNGLMAQRQFAYDRWGNRTKMYDATSGGNRLQDIDLEQITSGIPSNRIQKVRSQATNVAAASNGATATASSTYNSTTTPASAVINGDRKGVNWGSGGGWSDNTPSTYPDWVQIDFSGSKKISEVDVFTIQDNYSSPSEPTETMTFSNYGATAYTVQYWDGSAWQSVGSAGVGLGGLNNKVWKKFTFSSVTTTKIRVNITNTADGISRLAEIEAYTSYEYDANGNVTFDGEHTYTYDGENRIVSIDGGTTSTYAYDHKNRRVKKVVGSTITHYVWQDSQVLAEHNGTTGAVITNYTYVKNRMISKTSSGTTSYFLSDKSSARLVLNTSGNVIGSQTTLPFGEELSTSGSTDKHLMANYERDSESSTDYAVNRQYNQNVGRFNRVDPVAHLERPQSLNRYAYATNEPIDLSDPDGLDPFLCVNCNWQDFCDMNPWFCADVYDFLPSQDKPTKQKDPPAKCDVVLPTDQTQLALVYSFMHEGTPIDKLRNPGPTYQIGDVLGNPTGDTINIDMLLQEMLFIKAAIENYARASNKSVLAAILDNHYMIDNTRNATQFYAFGKTLATLALHEPDNGFNNCTKLKLAVSASQFELAPGYLPANIQHWRGIRGPSRIREGDDAYIRVAYTDFIP